MNNNSKIYPKWGKNRYNLWGCESLKYQDPEIDRIAQSFGSYPKKITFKQIRKFKEIACRGCTHFITGQCPFSKEEIEQHIKKFKLLKPKCSVCSLPISFHYFLFERNSPEQLCIMCLEAKINGTLEERKKKTKRSKMPEILQLICMSVVLLLSTAEAFFDGVFDWGDYIFIGLFSFLFLFGLTYLLIKRKRKRSWKKKVELTMLKITVLYENHKNPTNTSLEIAHGFSAYLEFEGKKILFDTGWHGSILLNNCKILNISLKDLDAIIISHAHWDHMGGLTHVLEVTDNPDIYIPDEFSKVQPKEIERYLEDPYVKRMKNFEVLSRLSQNIASTGTYKPVGEQALLIKYGENDETILIVGCSHPGIAPFIESSRKFGDVITILGGFHGFKDVDYLIKKTNVNNLHMGHCTQHIENFQKEVTLTTSSINVGYQITL